MRGLSLWIKINAAILLAFLVAALAFGCVLHLYMVDRLASVHNRTRTLLAAVAAHRLEKLAPLLEQGRTPDSVQDILDRLVRVEGVADAALFGRDGALLARAGEPSPAPLVAGERGAMPTGRVFSVISERGRLTAVLLEPIVGQSGPLGFLRLSYSLKPVSDFNQRLWLLFALALVSSYGLMAGLLNLLLHRFVLHPVDTLGRALEAVESGRLDQCVPVVSRDALGRTAAAFNAMVARLRHTAACLDTARAEVEEQRRMLELRVETRTAELAATNARLMTEMAGRCRAEEERKRLLALHRVILESRAEGVICVAAGEQRQVLAVNRRFLDLWGLPEHWAETGGPERLALVFQKLKDGEASEGVFETLMGDAESISENVLELCDGRFLERRSGPIRQGQAFWGRVFSYVDVTDRRRDEESLRQALAQRDALLGNSQVGLATVRGRVCVDINRRGAEILGYDREELLGQATRLIFRDEDDYLAACQEFENRLDAVGAVSAERQVRRRDGSMVWVRAHGKRVRPSGSFLEVAWAFDDITPEMERQARLEQARREAEDASRAKGTFLAVMSHEIRTPLNVIMGLTELLLDQDTTDEQRGYLRTVQDSVSHLIGIINDILDFSKIEAGKLVLERLDFDLPALLDTVTRVMEVQAGQKGLAFAVTVAPDVPTALRGDPGRLRQVLLNLLGNAVKFTETGNVTLHVERADAATTPAGKAGLCIRITDTGIGIAADRLPELFSSFQQGSNAIARRFGGTGLGLAISKEIVERMGGHIEVSTTEGQGSVFICTLFMEPGDPDKAVASRETVEAMAAVLSGPPLRVLLVEDNALNATVTRLHLDRMGHELALASSAKSAYAQLARERYDVVLMDIEMPEIDGITATRTIRAGGPPEAPVLDPNVPIVAVTAHAVEDVRQQCLEAGMDGFVTKPLNYRALELSLRKLDRRQFGSTVRASTLTKRPESPRTALFDPEGARQAMGISWKDYAELSRVSYAEGQVRLGEVRTALATGNFERATLAAHTFKGIAATMGAYSSREMGLALEQAVRAANSQAASELLTRLGPLWEAAGRALDQWQEPEEGEPR